MRALAPAVLGAPALGGGGGGTGAYADLGGRHGRGLARRRLHHRPREHHAAQARGGDAREARRHARRRAGARGIVERREGRRDLDLPVAPRAEIFIGGARHRAGREVQPRAHPRSEDGGGQPLRAGVDRLRRCRGRPHAQARDQAAVSRSPPRPRRPCRRDPRSRGGGKVSGPRGRAAPRGQRPVPGHGVDAGATDGVRAESALVGHAARDRSHRLQDRARGQHAPGHDTPPRERHHFKPPVEAIPDLERDSDLRVVKVDGVQLSDVRDAHGQEAPRRCARAPRYRPRHRSQGHHRGTAPGLAREYCSP